MSINNLYNKNFKDNFLGIVEDIQDPLKIGRVKIRVFSVFDELDVEHIPWARPKNNFTSGGISGGGQINIPKLGSIVNVTFDSGNIYYPEYSYNQTISSSLKSEIENSYPKIFSLVYDDEFEVKIFYTDEKKLIIQHKENIINIKDSDVEIISKEKVNIKCETVNLDANKINIGDSKLESSILGETFKNLFDNHIHKTPVGPTDTPITISMQPMNTQEYLSKHVKNK